MAIHADGKSRGAGGHEVDELNGSFSLSINRDDAEDFAIQVIHGVAGHSRDEQGQ